MDADFSHPPATLPVMLEQIEIELRAGREPYDAIVQACLARMRPILMTAFAFILGLMPLVLASGAGANSRQSLGTAVVGGLTLATVLIVFVPIFYVVIERMREGKTGGPASAPSAAPQDS